MEPVDVDVLAGLLPVTVWAEYQIEISHTNRKRRVAALREWRQDTEDREFVATKQVVDIVNGLVGCRRRGGRRLTSDTGWIRSG